MQEAGVALDGTMKNFSLINHSAVFPPSKSLWIIAPSCCPTGSDSKGKLNLVNIPSVLENRLFLFYQQIKAFFI